MAKYADLPKLLTSAAAVAFGAAGLPAGASADQAYSHSALHYIAASAAPFWVTEDGAAAARSAAIQQARSQYAAGQYEEAVRTLYDAVTDMQQSDRAEAYVLMAQAYIELGAGVSAETAVLSARENGADYASTVLVQAKALLLQSRFEQALSVLQGARTAPSEGVEANIIEGDAHFALSQYNEAQAAYERAANLAEANESAEKTEPLGGVAGVGPALHQPYLGLARLAMKAGNLAEAVRYADKAYSVAPNDSMVLYTKGVLAQSVGDITEAERLFHAATDAFDGNIPAWLELVRIAIDSGDVSAAEVYLDSVYSRMADHPAARYFSAVIAAMKGNYDEAYTILLQAGGFADQFLPALYVRGLTALQSGHTVQAERDLLKLLAARPSDDVSRLALAVAQLRLNKFSAALTTVDPLLKPDSAVYMRALSVGAAAKAGIGDLAASADMLKTLQTAGHAPEDVNAQLFLLSRLQAPLTQAGKAAGKVGALDAGEGALLPSPLSSAQVVQNVGADIRQLALLSVLEERRGNTKAALAIADKLISAAPQRAIGYNIRGGLLLAEGDYHAALAAFEQAIERNKDYTTAVRNKGLALAALGRHGQAVAVFKRVLASDESDLRTRANLGRSLLLSGDAAAALPHLRAAVQVTPANAEVYLDYVRALERVSGTLDAAAALTAYLPQLGSEAAVQRRAGTMLLDMNAPDAAARVLSLYRSQRTNAPEAHILYGRALLQAGLRFGAMQSFMYAERLLSRTPQNSPTSVSEKASGAAPAQNIQAIPLSDVAWYKAASAETVSAAAISSLGVDSIVNEVATNKVAAIKSLKALLDARPIGVSARFIIDFYSHAGRAAALEPLAAVFAESSRSAYEASETSLALANLFEYLGDKGRAAQMIAEGLKAWAPAMSPAQEIMLRSKLADLYLAVGDRRSQAEAKALYALSPQDASVLEIYGWVMLQSARETDLAVAALEKAAKYAPERPERLYRLAMAYLAGGQTLEARKALVKALKLPGDFPSRVEAEQRLEAL